MALVVAARFDTSLEATMAQGRLAAEGIEGYLFDVGVNSAELGPIAPVRLMVDAEELDAARRVLAEV